MSERQAEAAALRWSGALGGWDGGVAPPEHEDGGFTGCHGRICTTSNSVPGGAPGPKGGGKPRSNRALTRASVLPWRAPVVGTRNRSEGDHVDDLAAAGQVRREPHAGHRVFGNLVELMALAADGRVRMLTQTYPLDAANDAMDDLDSGRLRGRGILIPADS